tara:strand:- start:520 stop:939 length:420 start_codon:yes stop_codon:yes gene_type:complete
MRKEYDWVDRTIFLMFAYAHITDWELADSERSLIQSKIDYVLKKINGDSYQYKPEIIANKMSTVYKYWSDVQDESLDEVLTELQDIASEIKKEDWFDPNFAQKMIDFLAEIAKADGIVLDNEKFSLNDLSNLWEVECSL